MKKLAPGSFFGEIRRRRNLNQFTFVESEYDSQIHIPLHCHARPFLYFVLDGVCSEVCDGARRTLEPMTLVFHPAGSSHSDSWHAGSGRCFSLEIPQATLSLADNILDHSLIFPIGKAIGLAARLYREFHDPDDLSPLAIDGLVLDLLAEAAPSRHHDSPSPKHGSRRKPPPWLDQVRNLLHDRFAEALQLSDIAATAGIHPMHLSRTFRKHFGRTVGQYVRDLRVESAARQLGGSSKPIAHIATDSGFSDQSHFTNTFTRHLGITPAGFRRHLHHSA